MVLGAGGAARSLIHACLALDSVEHIRLLNRTLDRALELQKSLGDERIWVGGFDNLEGASQGADLVINTTSLGMDGFGHSPIVPFSSLDDAALIYDIIYNPFETGLLKAAKSAGFRTANGLGMLIEQARPSFENWFGLWPDRDEGLETILYSALSAYTP